MRKTVFRLALVVCLLLLFIGAYSYVATVFDVNLAAAPPSPKTGRLRVYADSGTGLLACLSAAGTNCMPGASGGAGTVQVGSYASFPASPANGALFFTNNSPHYYVWNGSVWDAYNFGQAGPLTTFVDSGYSWVNQKSGSVAQVDRDFVFSIANGTSGDQTYAYLNSATLTIPYTLTLHFVPATEISGGDLGFGILIKDSVSGKLQHYGWFTNVTTSQNFCAVTNLNTETSLNGGAALNTIHSPTGGIWIVIQNNSTTRTFSHSSNGIDYITDLSQAAGTFLTENRYGLGLYPGGGTTNQVGSFRVDSFRIQ